MPVPQSIDNYTEEQYNDFGLVSVNGVLTGKETKKLYSQFSDIDNHVLIKGSNQNPVIRKVISVNKDVPKELKSYYLKELVYGESDYRTNRNVVERIAGQTIFLEYTRDDFESFVELKQQNTRNKEIHTNDKNGQFRTGSFEGNRKTINKAPDEGAFNMSENENHTFWCGFSFWHAERDKPDFVVFPA